MGTTLQIDNHMAAEGGQPGLRLLTRVRLADAFVALLKRQLRGF